MTTILQFTSKQNISLLWDVLLDELHILNSNSILINNVRTIFESNIRLFVERANPNASIMELNKQFLSQVVLAVNKLFPTLKQEQSIKRITILDEEINEPYKIEDIHASRQTEFEREVGRKKMELENYMTPQKPPDVDFAYKTTDGKITAMDSLIAEKMAQRNAEIEQLQNGNYNTALVENPTDWLSPKETSIKTENQKRIRTGDNIEFTIKEKKVSWDETSTNIFQKLKKRSSSPTSKPQYAEQPSAPLPEVKQEQVSRNIPTTIQQQSPIIPTNEFIKQINEMNHKIDKLFEIVSKLTNETISVD